MTIKKHLLVGILFIIYSTVFAAEPLHWAGCGISKKAFMAELASSYQKKTGQEIILEGGGAAKGIRRVASGEVAIGGTCRPRLHGNPEEARALLTPVAWDALTVIVHPKNQVKNITLNQLKGLLEGRITNWKELGGDDQTIDLLIRRGKFSGVGRTLRELVFDDYNKVFISDHIYKSSGPLEKAVETNPNAIGITGISSAKKRKVNILSLNGKSPSYENIKTGKYLLYRPLYITSNPAHPRYRDVKKFINFAHSSVGRGIIRRAGAVPYLDALNLISRQQQQWQNARAQLGG